MSRNVPELLGHRVGMLTVVERVGIRRINDKSRMVWKCRCACGGEREETTARLRSKRENGSPKVWNCGCLRARAALFSRRLPPGEAAFNKLLNMYKYCAAERGYAWCLTADEFRGLTKGDCAYCGVPPSAELFYGAGGSSYTYNGIDRVNNDVGYIATNVASCCKTCNTAKMGMGLNDFLLWATRVATHNSGVRK